jgi:hypothetical protein
MQNHRNIANLRNSKHTILGDFAATSLNLRERDTIVTLMRSEAREAWLFSVLRTAKETLECLIQSLWNILQNLRMYLFQIRVQRFAPWQAFNLIVTADTLLVSFPPLFALSKKLIVKPATAPQNRA